MDSILRNRSAQYRLTGPIELEAIDLRFKTQLEITKMMQMVRVKRKLVAIPLAPTLNSIMERRNERYALVLIGSGFGRIKENYGGQLV